MMPPLVLAAGLVVVTLAARAGVPLDEPIKPVPAAKPAAPSRVALGRKLFGDPRLSNNGRVSCASCHDLNKGGADSRALSLGFDGKPTAVNAPTVYNAALNFRQFWNGRAETLEAQIEQVIVNPVEMGSQWPALVARLVRDDAYRREFGIAYPDGLTKANIIDAIATFERSLVTPNSRFDNYLRGDPSALTATEKAGYAKFKTFGCVACHQGVNVGGNMYQRFGVMGDYFAQRGGPTQADLGRFLVTGAAHDRHVFKVPGLRNVALTAPYFHDGSARTLEEAVDVMFRYQLGRVGARADKDDIVKFLHTLTSIPEQP